MKMQPTSDGTYTVSQGGTEQMARGLQKRLAPEYYDKFQIICSRVRDLEPGKKKILWLHDFYTDPENQHLLNPFDQQKFEKFVFVTQQQFHSYKQAYKVPYAKSVVLRNAIDPIEHKEKPKDQVNIIYHTTPHRGLELLVPAFVNLAKIHPNIHLDVYSSFKIYGWDNRDAPYEKIFEVCRNHPNITYHGFQPNDVVRAALQKAHIFGFPSIWPETSCLAAIEAAAAGCAVVAPDYEALSETLHENGFGYRFNEDIQGHYNEFVNRLNTAIINVNRPEVQTYLKNQSDVFNNRYSWDRRIKEWADLLDSLSDKS